MDRRNARGPRRGPRFWLTLLATTVLLAGCTGSSTTPSPLRTAASPSPSAVRTSLPTALATPGPAASADPTAVATGALPPQSSGTPVSTPTPRPTAGPDLAISTVARAPADPAAAKTAAASISAFGLDLLRQLLADPSLNLAMLFMGQVTDPSVGSGG